MKYFLLLGCLVFSTQLTNAKDTSSALATSETPAKDGVPFSGKVVETTNTAGYTYVLVDTGAKKLWAAATQFQVMTGDTVTVANGMPMSNYHSKSLNRNFDVVYFTGSIVVNGGDSAAARPATAMPPGHPPIAAAKPAMDLTGIKRADGGQTIQELFAGKALLAGKPVTVRGKVVKYNAMILGKNWLHIRDGSGSTANKDNDLTVTTATATKVGDTVLVTGNVSINKDFGAGYKYDLMIDEAKVTVE